MQINYEAYKALKLNRPSERVLEVVMDNPGRLNSLDADGHREIAEIWRDADADPEISAVLLRGAGGNFSAGQDLKEYFRANEGKPAQAKKARLVSNGWH